MRSRQGDSPPTGARASEHDHILAQLLGLGATPARRADTPFELPSEASWAGLSDDFRVARTCAMGADIDAGTTL